MDIIQLLEVLKPAKDVVTVQIASQKDQLAPWIDLAKAVLPAAATAGVAWLAMKNSHRQFDKSSERQATEFKLGIEQQVSTLKINTQLATEVALKKENCNGVRDSCARFLSHATQASLRQHAYGLAEKNASIEELDVIHNQWMDEMREMTASKIILLSFLSPEADRDFYKAIQTVGNEMDAGCESLGIAGNGCLIECRNYIMRKHQEIIDLTNNINDLSKAIS
ncbi:hypothetical protein [Enterobacter sp. 296B2]|nr:hypothetical protein [Enterobacter sp. 296B2]